MCNFFVTQCKKISNEEVLKCWWRRLESLADAHTHTHNLALILSKATECVLALLKIVAESEKSQSAMFFGEMANRPSIPILPVLSQAMDPAKVLTYNLFWSGPERRKVPLWRQEKETR